MGETVTLVLLAIEVPDHITDTAAGDVRVPGTRIPEEHVAIDAELLSEPLTKQEAPPPRSMRRTRISRRPRHSHGGRPVRHGSLSRQCREQLVRRHRLPRTQRAFRRRRRRRSPD